MTRLFLSYASADREAVIPVGHALAKAGIEVWRDAAAIPGGSSYGPEIVRGIRDSAALAVCCSNASLASRNVAQEIRIAWKYAVPYLPLLLEPVDIPEQLQYWLEGWQWIDLQSRTAEEWLPDVAGALTALGAGAAPGAPTGRASTGELVALWRAAAHTERIWTSPAGPERRVRDLGGEPEPRVSTFALGSRVAIGIESDFDGHLLFLDRGPSGTIYLLCPSPFAPDMRIRPGRMRLPQPGAPAPAFTVTGEPGREQLLALLTRHPLEVDWDPAADPSRVRRLSRGDADALVAALRGLPEEEWRALSTFFRVIA